MITVLSSCLSNSGSLPFSVYGETITMTEDPGIRKAEEGKMLLIDGTYSTPVYSLKEPYSVKESNSAFFVKYNSSAGLSLDIYLENKKIADINLPGGNSIIHFQIPLRPGDELKGFKIKSLSSMADKESFRLISAGIESEMPGFKVKKSDNSLEVIVKNGFIITDKGSRFDFGSLSAEADKESYQVQIEVDYDYRGSAKKEYEIVIFSKDHEKSFGLNARRGGKNIFFYSDSLGFVPEGIRFENSDSYFDVTGIGINSFSKMAPADFAPVPADIGTMLTYSISAWRRDDFEVFSWNLFPDILLIDFRDYALQSASLKRLSFFVEKDGFTGRLLDNKVLSGLHGWNAHDYRAESLAEFFNKAEDENFELNPEELILRDLLLGNKIIAKSGTEYIPLSGGILAYSQESSPRLRRLFITHEGYHGIFFSDLQFAADVKGIWNNLEEPEKEFWYNFLGWKRYETEDSYLVANEFMAYLMQQNISQIESYYKEYIIPRYLVAFPDKSEEMNAFLEDYPDHFLRNAEEVEKIAFRYDSITAGELRCLH